MLYRVENGKSVKTDLKKMEAEGPQSYYGFFDTDEGALAAQKFGLSAKPLNDLMQSKPMVFESHEGFDMICVNLLNQKAIYSQANRVCIYVSGNATLFICKNPPQVLKMMHDYVTQQGDIGYDHILSTFFERTILKDTEFLEKIEQEISDLENALITSKKRDCVKEIISLRKKLMALKRHYEQFLDLLDELQENENNLLSDHSLRHFKIFAGRVERLYRGVLNLRDYVTQVREAYQAEVDISLNYVMKVFTVITAIFLPLTLIVGWYGMNLKMPEFEWSFGYPMVIIISITVVAICLFYFKKNKWY